MRAPWFQLVACGIGCAASGCGRSSPAASADAGVDAAGIDATAGGEFASCSGLSATCGAAGNDSCCDCLGVPGGTYHRSLDAAGDASSGNLSHPATVSGFRLDRYEVTVGRFRAFVNAGMGIRARPPSDGAGAHQGLPGSGWDPGWSTSLPADPTALIASLRCDTTAQTWTDAVAGNENRPMNCLTWYEAMAFCIWDGGYLPTEAEWNYAAAGGDQQRAYPWSNPASSLIIDGAHASYYDGSDCVGDGLPDCTVTDLVSVGRKAMGDGRWGHSDLGGNVVEWTLDWHAAYPDPCTDCANLTPAVTRVLRGGAFGDNDEDLRTGARLGLVPTDHNSFTGVRCARTP